ncbi:hypothetical protein HPB47_003972 [Ixodes persulcatus]|uniref:Uncharacterized protein n=1 Tax=Ixodes persulcatus TaxID=34615 RepID=A0AC60PGX6_IXOPE|nr:hypothetical protein HPB47_003972 [Ixodes persulcatus]
MRSLQNPFCFILQILAFLGAGLPSPRQPATISAPSSCTVFLAAIGDDIAPVFDATVAIIVNDYRIFCEFKRLVTTGRFQWAQRSGSYAVASKSLLLHSRGS